MGLFSTMHIHQSKTEYVPYCKEVNVTEKRAPTDESIRLLNEMQHKAQQNIIATIPIEGNVLKGLAIYYMDDRINQRMNYHIKFQLNGEEHKIEGFIDKFEWSSEIAKTYFGLGHQGIFEVLYKKVSEIIAYHLMRQSPDFIEHMSGKRSL